MYTCESALCNRGARGVVSVRWVFQSDAPAPSVRSVRSALQPAYCTSVAPPVFQHLNTHHIMVVSLNPSFYPHIFETILRQCDSKTLLAARLVCHSLCALADRSFWAEQLLIRYDPNFFDSPGILRVSDPYGHDVFRLPYFHPDGSVEKQCYAMSHAKSIQVICGRISPRLFNLLHYASSTCELDFCPWEVCVHSAANWGPRFWPALDLDVPFQCPCHSSSFKNLAMSWQIAPSNFADFYCLGLNLPYDVVGEFASSLASRRCPLVAGAVTRLVLELEIVGNVFSFPKYLEGHEVQVHPELNVCIYQAGHQSSPDAMEALRGEIADCLKISKEQVHWMPEDRSHPTFG